MENQQKQKAITQLYSFPVTQLSLTELARLYLDDSLGEEILLELSELSEREKELMYVIIAMNWYLDNREVLEGKVSFDTIIMHLMNSRPIKQEEFDTSLETALELIEPEHEPIMINLDELPHISNETIGIMNKFLKGSRVKIRPLHDKN